MTSWMTRTKATPRNWGLPLCHLLASPFAASPPGCDELKARGRGQSLRPSAISPPRPLLGPLPDQRGGPYVTLSYCMAFILLDSWGRDLSWLFPALPANSPFLQTSQGLLYLCLATGSTSSGISLCQMHFWKDLFFCKEKQ